MSAGQSAQSAQGLRFLDEYRDRDVARRLLDAIHDAAKHPWAIMEVCGGQTHSIVRHGLDTLLPPTVELLHGPGCPVCVTPIEMIDRAHAIAALDDVILCSFGDMLRVPGSHGDLLSLKARGHDIRIVYSPLDAVAVAEKNPGKRVVFFAVGFETTAPANATAVVLAQKRKLKNFSLLVSHVLVPPALDVILSAPGNRVQAFLGPGHVATVMGTAELLPIVAKHNVPIVVCGFEPVDLLDGILRAVRQLEAGLTQGTPAYVDNAYARVVKTDGNASARALLSRVFTVVDRAWRGVGVLKNSGWALRPELAAYDAEVIFDVKGIVADEPAVCIAGEVLQGRKKPFECPAFGNDCTPDTPLGATMVSNEGACAAYFLYAIARRPRPAIEPAATAVGVVGG